VAGGHVKVGWKVDWALRWYAYEVDYEMYGKDLIDSARLSGRIVQLMGRRPPAGLTYELFLDEEGRKISKSVGRGLTVDAWTRYAPLESLLYFIYQNPKRAKRLYWDIVPRCVDQYLAALRRYPSIPAARQPEDDLWHICDRGRQVPEYQARIDFTTVNNLIAALGTDSAPVLTEYLLRYDPAAVRYGPVVRGLVDKALAYYRDFVVPDLRLRPPRPEERQWLRQLQEGLAATDTADEEALQALPFAVARQAGIDPADLFRCFYEVVFGQERGPRFGSFVALAGREQVGRMIERRLGE
jgi:lysyl-tRNA synthetase, class I